VTVRGAKKLVLAAHPSATCGSRRDMGGRKYWLVRIHDDGPSKNRPRFMPSGSGDTEQGAWTDAARKLGLLPKAGPK
jgi:hypothetical protein